MGKHGWLCVSNRSNVLAQQAWLVIAISVSAILAGCLSRPELNRQFFTFAIPANNSPARSNNGRVLAIRRVSVAAPFANQSFVYRTGELSYEQDPYAQFLVPPEDDLQEPLRSYLLNTGQFQTVTEEGSAAKPNLLVEVSVQQLYGDFGKRTQPAAVLEMSFTFFAATD